jgi:small subunit ribosomal protein S3
MGQKISVDFFRARKRLSKITNNSGSPSELQRSVWFASGNSYAKLLKQDLAIRAFIKKEVPNAGLVEIIIRRYFRKVEVVLFVTKPGMVIGKSGAIINKLREDLVTKFELPKDIKLDIMEFRNPLGSAQVIADEISESIKKGFPYRRVAKGYIEKLKFGGVLGVKIQIKGRLNGADIARKEDFAHGSVPRHTIDSDIDYSLVHCQTRTGIIGVKVWLYKGDKLKNYSNANN